MKLGVHVGIRSGGGQIRIARRNRWKRRFDTMSIELHGEPIADALTAVEERFGSSSSISVALDTESLFVKRVALPPISPAEKCEVLRVEPERFFPIRGEEVVLALAGDGDLAFAAPADEISEWLTSLEALGRIDRVVPSPCALTRIACSRGTRTLTIINRCDDCTVLIAVVDGRVQNVRKVFGAFSDALDTLLNTEGWPQQVVLVPWSDTQSESIRAVLPTSDPKPLSLPTDLNEPYAAAYGAVEADGEPLTVITDGLMPAGFRRRLMMRRRIRVAASVAAAAAATAFALFAWDLQRTRTVTWLTREIAAYQERAAPSLALRAELSRLEDGALQLANVADSRPDPLHVLQLITNLLPRDSWIRTVRYEGNEWELDGYAKDAAQLIPLFESSTEFEGVEFRTATSRAHFDNEPYESFSLALRYVSPS